MPNKETPSKLQSEYKEDRHVELIKSISTLKMRINYLKDLCNKTKDNLRSMLF